MTGASPPRRPTGLLPLLPGGLFLLGLFVTPLVGLFVLSLTPVNQYNEALSGITFDQYRLVFTKPFFYDALWYTVRLALVVTVLCAILAYPVAWLYARARSVTIRTLVVIIVVSPLLTSVVVRSFGWRVILSAEGPVNRVLLGMHLISEPLNLLTGPGTVIVAVTHVLLPFAVVTLSTSLGRIDHSLLRASASIGAGPVRTFSRIVLPLSIPGLASGAAIVFSLAMGIYVTPLLVGGANQPLAGLRIYNQALLVFNQPSAAALSFVLFGISMFVIVCINSAAKRWERRIHV